MFLESSALTIQQQVRKCKDAAHLDVLDLLNHLGGDVAAAAVAGGGGCLGGASTASAPLRRAGARHCVRRIRPTAVPAPAPAAAPVAVAVVVAVWLGSVAVVAFAARLRLLVNVSERRETAWLSSRVCDGNTQA